MPERTRQRRTPARRPRTPPPDMDEEGEERIETPVPAPRRRRRNARTPSIVQTLAAMNQRLADIEGRMQASPSGTSPAPQQNTPTPQAPARRLRDLFEGFASQAISTQAPQESTEFTEALRARARLTIKAYLQGRGNTLAISTAPSTILASISGNPTVEERLANLSPTSRLTLFSEELQRLMAENEIHEEGENYVLGRPPAPPPSQASTEAQPIEEGRVLAEEDAIREIREYINQNQTMDWSDHDEEELVNSLAQQTMEGSRTIGVSPQLLSDLKATIRRLLSSGALDLDEQGHLIMLTAGRNTPQPASQQANPATSARTAEQIRQDILQVLGTQTTPLPSVSFNRLTDELGLDRINGNDFNIAMEWLSQHNQVRFVPGRGWEIIRQTPAPSPSQNIILEPAEQAYTTQRLRDLPEFARELEDRIYGHILENDSPGHSLSISSRIYESLNSGNTESEISQDEVNEILHRLQARGHIIFDADSLGWHAVQSQTSRRAARMDYETHHRDVQPEVVPGNLENPHANTGKADGD